LFENCKICFSDKFEFKRKSELGAAVKLHGGVVSFMLVKSQCTQLVATEDEVKNGGQTLKVRSAMQSSIPIVSVQWILDSISKSQLQPIKQYLLASAGVSSATGTHKEALPEVTQGMLGLKGGKVEMC